MSAPTTDAQPPRGYFAVGQRLMRGYGPLAVFALMLLLMSVLVPSKVPDDTVSAGSGSGSDGGSGAEGPETVVTTPDGAAGRRRRHGRRDRRRRGRRRRRRRGAAGGCPDRKEQVPGDPYSPPCMAFSGSNGGGTSKGVTDKDDQGRLPGAQREGLPADARPARRRLAVGLPRLRHPHGRARSPTTSTSGSSSTAARSRSSSTTARARTPTSSSARAASRRWPTPSRWPTRSAPSPTCPPPASPTPAPSPTARSSASARRTCPASGTRTTRPYAWSIATDGSIVSEFAAEYAVKKLYGGNADHAGGALKGKPRKFGTLAPENSWYQESVDNAEEVIKKAGPEAGLPPGLRARPRHDVEPGHADHQRLQEPRHHHDPLRLRPDPAGVPVRRGEPGAVLPRVHHRGHRAHRRRHRRPALEPELRQPRLRREPARRLRAAHPDDRLRRLQVGARRTSPPSRSTSSTTRCTCWRSACRWPVPTSTRRPSTRAWRTTRPRPGPFGLWDFGPGDRTAANDVREIYWDPGAISTYNGKQGAYIGANKGARFQTGQIPKADAGSSDQRGPDMTAVALAGRRRLERAVPLGAGRHRRAPRLRRRVPRLPPAAASGRSSRTRRPFGTVVTGVIYGTVNALLAIGLILIYKTSRFINFAYALDGQPRRRHRHRPPPREGRAVLRGRADRRGDRHDHRPGRRARSCAGSATPRGSSSPWPASASPRSSA